MTKSRMEELLEALLNGEATDVVPQSRAEACLKNCIDGTGAEGLPEPQSRLEAYLHALAEKMAGGGGGGSFDVYVDPTLSDTHVYRTPDISDSSNRVATEEIKKALADGRTLRAVQSYEGEVFGYLIPSMIVFEDSVTMIGCTLLDENGNAKITLFYTAEYTLDMT